MTSATINTQATTSSDTNRLAQTVIHAAWLAIAVGMVAQLAVLATKTFWTADTGTVSKFLADLVQKVSWSVIVCVGLAFGSVAKSLKPSVTGIMGMLAAPLAIVVARSVHKSISQVLGVAVENPPLSLTLTLCGIKGAEYLLLGALLGWLSLRQRGGVFTFMGLGASTGFLFGTLLLLAVYLLAPVKPPAVEFASRWVNEMVQPIGCCLAYFAAERLAKMFSLTA